MDTPRYAAVATDGWQLQDGEERHREHPATFEIPSPAVRRNLRRGDLVKLMFEIHGPDSPGVERMWVATTERHGDRYLGVLDNQPISLDPADPDAYLRPGAEICFGPEHVIAVYDEPVPTEVLDETPTRRWPR